MKDALVTVYLVHAPGNFTSRVVEREKVRGMLADGWVLEKNLPRAKVVKAKGRSPMDARTQNIRNARQYKYNVGGTEYDLGGNRQEAARRLEVIAKQHYGDMASVETC